MSLFWRALLLLLALTLGLAALVEALAWAAWSFSGAGSVSIAALEGLAAPDRFPTTARLAPRVAEWPAERGRAFQEAPAFHDRVTAGELPPVAQRLPENPLVIVPPEQNGPYGGTWIRYAIDNTTDMAVQLQCRLCHEPFLRWDSLGRQLVPNLATGVDVSPDGRDFTFHLRRGVRWSDGEPYTAADVVFWYEDLLLNKEFTPSLGSDLVRGGKPVQVTKLDDYTVRFSFAEPNGLFLKKMTYQMWGDDLIGCPRHYLMQFHPRYADPAKLQAALQEVLQTTNPARWPDLLRQRWDWRNPECPRTWAWIVTVPPPALQVVCERNPYYWKVDPDGRQLPYIDQLAFEVTDKETINLKALNGELMMQERHLDPKNYPLLMESRAQSRRPYQVRHWIGGGGSAVTLNLNHRDPVMREIFEDRRFRIALSHAIDRQELNRLFYFGAGQPRQVAPAASSPFYLESQAKAHLEYDPARAARMLDEMGLPRGPDGVRLRPDGQPLTIRLECTETDTRTMLLVAEYWTRVGVKTDVKEEARQLFYARKAAMLHDATAYFTLCEQDPTLDPRFYFPAGSESNQAVGYAQWFESHGERGMEPPAPIRRCMELFRRIEGTPNQEEQVRCFKEILALNEENLWVIGLVSGGVAMVVVREDFKNVPDVSLADWTYRGPGNTAPECYVILPDHAP